jgi:hypothetical protein
MDIDIITLALEAALVSWGNPVAAGVAAFVIFVLLSSISRITGRRGAPMFDTRRAKCLREAAQLQHAQHDARERRRNPRESRIIFLSAEWERRWWCSNLSVTTDKLQAAVRQVGPMVDDVERYLASA